MQSHHKQVSARQGPVLNVCILGSFAQSTPTLMSTTSLRGELSPGRSSCRLLVVYLLLFVLDSMASLPSGGGRRGCSGPDRIMKACAGGRVLSRSDRHSIRR